MQVDSCLVGCMSVEYGILGVTLLGLKEEDEKSLRICFVRINLCYDVERRLKLEYAVYRVKQGKRSKERSIQA